MKWGNVSFGEPEPLGVTPCCGGVNVAVFSAHADAIEFCMFENEREVRRITLRGRTSDIFHDHVEDVAPGVRYGLRAHGPYRPHEGHYFNPAKLLADPYARAVDRPFRLHESMFGFRNGSSVDLNSPDDTDSAPFVPKCIVVDADYTRSGTSRMTPWPNTVLYELHVRGFTARHPDIPENLRGRFAGLAHPASIEHLVRLGVTTVEIMPAAAWVEERHLKRLGLRNYWGYNPITFMAPDPGLAPGGWEEIRAAVAALGAAGIEVILDVVFNHSGEGDALGPTLSLRGLDNASYYRGLPGLPWRYVDDAGCGNTLALDRPAPLRLTMDSLRTWAESTGLHGFRFDLATTMGRRDNGFDPHAPLLSAIAQDPLLRNLKLIAEPWDIGPGGYQVGAFPATWGEWNDRFRDSARRFWRGDAGQLGELATRLAGSADLFGSHRVASRSINFVVAHDGFTLADLVSYTHKVNAANGEENRDGTDANFSWNNGAEGPSEDIEVTKARARDQRALLATLILARGTPMLAMGAEFGQSQAGNNNAYAQDNPVAWLDWARGDEGLMDWTRRLLRIRHDFPLLRGERFLTGEPGEVSFLPDVEWRDASGQIMTPETWQNPGGNTVVMTLAGTIDAGNSIGRVGAVLHRGHADISVTLPPVRAGYTWHLLADSSADVLAEEFTRSCTAAGPQRGTDAKPDDYLSWFDNATNASAIAGPTVHVAARSVLVVTERPRDNAGRVIPDPALVRRLADAAGVAPEWWDVEGRRTIVSDDTRRSLLAAMRLEVGTEGEARDTLRQLSNKRDRRAVPQALLSYNDAPSNLRLGIEAGLGRRAVWLLVEREDGETQRVRLGAEDGTLETFTGADGLPAKVWRVNLPVLPEGRHRLWREDAPETVCYLTVAPRHCFLPDRIRRGGKYFGISAQLYALRREGDQGIGDFTTLARLAEAAGRERAATIGINPLHMLFPGDRERASPYHPSDRRFLDPIYLDIGDEGGAAACGHHVDKACTADQVAYSQVWAAKKAILEERFSALAMREKADPSATEALQRFVVTGGLDLWRFAVFQAISEKRPGETWRQWPATLRSPGGMGVESFALEHADRVRFHQYLQFLADQQFSTAAMKAGAAGLELGIYRDLAVGAAPDGAESWCRSDELATGAWVGAPPDPFAADGQNWHLPPPLPLRMAETGFASFACLLASNMRHAGALRIDHAMGLSRLFWIPEGGTGTDGAYVSYPFADLVGQVALESVRARCLVVGEDLGTVPDGFRSVLSEADILSYRVLLLEREGRGFKPASSYPARAVACVSTHDLPPLAGWLEGADIQERLALGLLRNDPDAERERSEECVALAEHLVREKCLARKGPEDSPIAEMVEGAHAFVASTASDLMLVQAEDLAGMRVGVNLPGTDRERPNWRIRPGVTVEALLTGCTAQSILSLMRESGRATALEDGSAAASSSAEARNGTEL